MSLFRGTVSAIPVKILVPYDSSDFSKLAFEKAVEMASKMDAKLHVLTVIGPDVNVSGMSYGRAQEALEEYENEANEEFEGLVTSAKKKNLSIKTHIIHDQSATSGINRFVEANAVDLVVIGSHGRTGLKSVLGSVATGVLNKSECPVMIVKMPKDSK
ncbi:MAG: universal stress protein [Nitrosopumilaceae archaeon]|nr:universal stress protein [Nitrosopumilaceae archaeon]NIU01402.1 universal stress protein [Nitrosopumilaceae archaeon]NIU87760.1 universal stress protein [Nitrosopumilaceae archaeon]NIV66138.1 universal stress protein [Nitrosopumilaceae archaeon]NIX62004.1 universal stress protein [Nitrosopumilaceae archaeon]